MYGRFQDNVWALPWHANCKCEPWCGLMPELKQQKIQRYLESLFGAPIKVCSLSTLGGERKNGDVKGYGYGVPVKVDFRTASGERRTTVLHTMSPGPFGHEHMADRAQELLWEHHSFNRLPRHVQSLDVCGFQPEGQLVSVSSIVEFGLLTEYLEGESYALDLERIRDTGILGGPDMARADALCRYLAEVHKVPGNDPGLYVRRIRELVGHGECIMGVTDAYPRHPMAPPNFLENVEHLCVTWRWRLKVLTHRLRQVHGDFHPWNVLFRSATDFSVLDRSRGEYGDPADDVTSLTLNYVFFSLQRSGRLEGAFEILFRRFWEQYLEQTGDGEMLGVVAPFLAFRALVMASPLWYPSLPDDVRLRLLTFLVSVLESERFDPKEVNRYCGV